jgi:Holliday junction DNA helicase RuvA
LIGKLTGSVDSTGDDWVILDVGGVGYVVFCSGRSLGLLPPAGGGATLWIETHVREDHIHLYGFAETAERDWFRLLNSVQGVGAKMALSILSVLPPADLVRAIAAQDKASLTRANGVGPKLAGRIASELKDKAGGIALGPVGAVNGVAAGAEVSEDAVSALVNLGYRRAEAFAAVAKASGDLGGQASVESLIKAGLKELAS